MSNIGLRNQMFLLSSHSDLNKIEPEVIALGQDEKCKKYKRVIFETHNILTIETWHTNKHWNSVGIIILVRQRRTLNGLEAAVDSKCTDSWRCLREIPDCMTTLGPGSVLTCTSLSRAGVRGQLAFPPLPRRQQLSSPAGPRVGTYSRRWYSAWGRRRIGAVSCTTRWRYCSASWRWWCRRHFEGFQREACLLDADHKRRLG